MISHSTSDSFRSSVMSTGATLVVAVLVFGLAACSSTPEPEPDDEPSSRTAADVYADAPQPATPDEERPEAPASELDGETDEVDDDLLARFADSLRALYELERKLEQQERTYEHRVAEAESPADVQQAQLDYIAEMEDAVHEQGMNFDDFLLLGKWVREDDQLWNRLLEEVDEAKVEEFFGM